MEKYDKDLITEEDYPKLILQDFLAFLNYLDSKKVPLTKANRYLTRKDFRAIYSLLEEHKPLVSEKGNQRDYPMINLFYHLAFDLQLIRQMGSKNSFYLKIEQDQLSAYQMLNPAEQYITLLQSFWTSLDIEELQKGYYGKDPYNADLLLDILEEMPVGKELKVSEHKELEAEIAEYGHFLYYFEYFGFWEVEIEEAKSYQPGPREYAKAKSIELTPLVKKLIPALIETWDPGMNEKNAIMELMSLFSPEPVNVNKEMHEDDGTSLFSLLQPLFAEGQVTNTLSEPEKVYVTGNYLFKISLDASCWRKLQLSSAHTLLDLHGLIQEAFGFDDDHLYSFFMDGKRFSKHAYQSPMDNYGPYVDKVNIGNMGLYEGQRFLYLFDFGDEWEFDIEVVRITEGKEGKAVILEKKGVSPDQYGF